MKVLFLSHNPHEVHLNFSKTIKARIKIIPFDKFISLSKRYPVLNYLYPIISFFYSFLISVKEDYVLVEGGSSLYVAKFLKFWHPKIKIILLDEDLFILKLRKINNLQNIFKKFILNSVDGIISASYMNKKAASKLLDVPIEIVIPYPKQIKKIKISRKNYGLYVGRLDPDKNIKRIVNFGLQCPYFEKFIIIGDGIFKKWVIEKSRKNKKLEFFGRKDNVQDYYSECKFLVHIPNYDPHPCTTMESAQCGCFPIVSKGVGSKYLFDDIFIIDNPRNFAEINNHIKYIVDNNQKAANLLVKSLKKIPKKEKTLKQFKKTFERIVSKIK